jgi:hypothetical protein
MVVIFLCSYAEFKSWWMSLLLYLGNDRGG